MKKIAVELQLPELPDYKKGCVSTSEAMDAAFLFMRLLSRCRDIREMFDHLDDDKEEIDNAFEVLDKAAAYWFCFELGFMAISQEEGLEMKS